MRTLPRFAVCCAAAAFALSCGSLSTRAAHVRHDPPEETTAETKTALKPEVAAFLKRSTTLYSNMKSYRHLAEYVVKGTGPSGDINNTTVYTLAMERPNKFCYRSDEADGSAAVSDGKIFINHKTDGKGSEHSYYTKVTAPANYKGINIVDDVTFTYGTYLVALMLQGDTLADKDVREGMEKATLKTGVMENNKKYDILDAPLGDSGRGVQFYFDADTHLLHKTVEQVEQERGLKAKVQEIIENVQVDKPIPAELFQYKPPKNARLIVRQNPPMSRANAFLIGALNTRSRSHFAIGPTF